MCNTTSHFHLYQLMITIWLPQGPYVGGTNSPLYHIYFLNGDNTGKSSMFGVQIGQSGQPKCMKMYTLFLTFKQPKQCIKLVAAVANSFC